MAAGAGYIVASVGEASGEIPYTAYFAKKSYINENKELIQNFTNAIYKGEVWVKEHTSEEIAEYLKNVCFRFRTSGDDWAAKYEKYAEASAR